MFCPGDLVISNKIVMKLLQIEHLSVFSGTGKKLDQIYGEEVFLILSIHKIDDHVKSKEYALVLTPRTKFGWISTKNLARI